MEDRPTGHYEYLFIPFGPCNAPVVFQTFVHKVLRECSNVFVFMYLDDILISCTSSASETTRKPAVHQGRKMWTVPVSFLGAIITANQVQMDPAKVSVVADWLTSDSCKKAQQFLGFANFYRKFIQTFSSVASPLHALTSSKTPFQ